jgi:hypothetical protein
MGFRGDVTLFRRDATGDGQSPLTAAFLRNMTERVYAIEAADNPEVAGSNPAPATSKGPGNGAFLFLRQAVPAKTLPAGQEQRPRAQKGVVIVGVDDDSSRQRGGRQLSAGAESTDQTAAPPAPKLVSRSGLDADQLASAAVTVPPSVSPVADGGELLG